MTTTLTRGWVLGLLLTCWWVGLGSAIAEEEVKVSSWCYSDNQSSKSISCDDKAHTIVVIRAFAGISERPVQNFCQFPRPSPRDCLLSEAAKTDDFRRECNTFNTCSFFVRNPPFNSCGPAYAGIMYFFVEYTCQPVHDEQGQHYPIIESCMATSPRMEASTLILYNVGYPTMSRPMENCKLTMWSNNGAQLAVTIRDFSHEQTDNLACPFHLGFSNGNRLCARRGRSYTTLGVLSGSSMEFVVNSSGAFGRYWIHISSVDGTGSVIIQFVDPSTQQTSTQQPLPEITTLGKPVTPAPTEPSAIAATSTQKPTETIASTPNSTVDTAPGHVTDNVTSHVTNQTDINSVQGPPGGSTVSPSRGPEDEVTGDLGLPPDVNVGIKIIIGGAIAGTVIVVLIVACVALCVRRKKKPPQKNRRDLGYSVHANLAIASKLGVKSGDLRSPNKRSPKKTVSHAYVNSPPLQQPFDNSTLDSSEHSYSNLGPIPRNVIVRRSSSKPTYQNADVRKSKRKSQHRRSASQTTLTTSIETNCESLDRGGRNQYGAVNDVFAAFPRWEDNPRYSGASDQYDQYTSTLPAKLNKKPMPLPKPKRTPSSVSVQMRQSPTPGPSSSVQSIDQYGTTSSTSALYAVPNKNRKSKDFAHVENELYVNSKRF